MSDIVERLRRQVIESPYDGFVSPLEAADEIERLRGVEQDAVEWVEERTKRLRADNLRLRAALREIVDWKSSCKAGGIMEWEPVLDWVETKARKALEREGS